MSQHNQPIYHSIDFFSFDAYYYLLLFEWYVLTVCVFCCIFNWNESLGKKMTNTMHHLKWWECIAISHVANTMNNFCIFMLWIYLFVYVKCIQQYAYRQYNSYCIYIELLYCVWQTKDEGETIPYSSLCSFNSVTASRNFIAK